eukprot:scaffold7549_cov111-Isochrysis_galbana.AAC.6
MGTRGGGEGFRTRWGSQSWGINKQSNEMAEEGCWGPGDVRARSSQLSALPTQALSSAPPTAGE